MTQPDFLSTEQAEIRSKITKGAVIWGVVAGLIVLGLIYWALSGQSSSLRLGGAIVAGGGVGFTLFRRSLRAGAVGAKCNTCNTAFSLSKTDSQKTLIKEEPEEERIEQEEGSVLVKNWVTETYDVLDTFTCAKCGDVTTKTYQSHSRRDETETTVHPKTEAKKTLLKTAKKQGKRAGKASKPKNKKGN